MKSINQMNNINNNKLKIDLLLIIVSIIMYFNIIYRLKKSTAYIPTYIYNILKTNFGRPTFRFIIYLYTIQNKLNYVRHMYVCISKLAFMRKKKTKKSINQEVHTYITTLTE